MLKNLIDNKLTDKNTFHSYLELYELLLRHKKSTATNVLEIIGSSDVGSIKLWHDYFPAATVHAVYPFKKDLNDMNDIKDNEKIKIYNSVDPYELNYFFKNFSDYKFDMVLDDGDHSLNSMISFITLYTKVLKDDGILIIEDIQSWDHVEFLKKVVPDELKPYAFAFDLRANKNRDDDIVFVINKSWK